VKLLTIKADYQLALKREFLYGIQCFEMAKTNTNSSGTGHVDNLLQKTFNRT
jgi:hypothetical protein